MNWKINGGSYPEPSREQSRRKFRTRHVGGGTKRSGRHSRECLKRRAENRSELMTDTSSQAQEARQPPGGTRNGHPCPPPPKGAERHRQGAPGACPSRPWHHLDSQEPEKDTSSYSDSKKACTQLESQTLANNLREGQLNKCVFRRTEVGLVAPRSRTGLWRVHSSGRAPGPFAAGSVHTRQLCCDAATAATGTDEETKVCSLPERRHGHGHSSCI